MDLTISAVVFFQGCVAPHLFQAVKFSLLAQHHMDHDVHVVDQNPLQVLLSLMVVGVLAAMLLHGIFYSIGDRAYLGGVRCFANNEEVGNSLGDLTQVERDHVLTFLILDGPYDGFENLRIPVESGSAFLTVRQYV
jgi:hypothetical protein